MQSENIDEIWLLTTTNLIDNPLASHFAGKIGMIRGHETDVRSRYESLFQQSQASHVIRVTGDCPLISPSLIDTLVDQCLSQDVEYGHISAQAFYPQSYPNGMNAELFGHKAFVKMIRMGNDERHKEHPTLPVDEWPDDFKILRICPPDALSRPKWKLSVDTLEDFERIERVIGQLGEEPILASIEQIIRVLDENPLWV
jgi:spore coat polysaccharide biosynthesis protein SpsF